MVNDGRIDLMSSVGEARIVEAHERLSTNIRYSICTLVTKPEQYVEMVASFRQGGFGGVDCEFIKIDNSQANTSDAYQGFNMFLTAARGEYIIVCHQDVLLIDPRERLEEALAELDRLDPAWAACGNSGGLSFGALAIRITDPHGTDRRTWTFPAKVHTLDENFIVVRRDANLSVSHDLGGFHLYGTDLCTIADILGRTTYVVDFHVHHLSPGKRDETLAEARRRMVEKYIRAFRGRWVRSSCELMYFSGLPLLARALSTSWSIRLTNKFKLGVRGPKGSR
jgi:hypothetical protein